MSRNSSREQNSKVIDLAERAPRKKTKKHPILRKIPMLLVVVLLILGIYLKMRMYTEYTTLSEQTHTDGVSGAYTPFGSGIVRYTNNGIQYINGKQKVVWEMAYEMKNPSMAVCGDKTLAAVDLRGNQIYVFDQKGLMGSISTTMPVQTFAVSEQGIVAAVVRSDDQTRLILYDAKGNTLVDGRVSFAETGYPLAVAISPNGQRVLVSYVLAETVVSSRVIGYDFTDVNAADEDRIILDESYPELIIPEVAFMDDSSCYAVGNGKLLFYGGSGKLRTRKIVEVEETIKSVVSDGKRVGVVTMRSEGDTRYALGVYNDSGRKQKFMNFDDEYNKIYMKGGQVFILEGSHCVIYSQMGQRVFDGQFDTTVSCIVPVRGIHKYLVAEEGKVETIRILK